MTKQSTGLIEEPGWWAHDALGVVCRESDSKWYGYPKIEPEAELIGPFKTAREAVEAVAVPDSATDTLDQLQWQFPRCGDHVVEYH